MRKHNSTKKISPLMTMILCILVVGLTLFACVFFAPGLADKAAGSFLDLSCIGYEYPDDGPKPTSEPTSSPEPASVHALYSADLATVQHEIILNEFPYLADLRYKDGDVWCAVGPYSSATGIAAFSTVCCIHPDEGTKEYYEPLLKHNILRFPDGNNRWIVYSDVMNSGGGRICAMDRVTGEQKELKVVHTGIPEPWVWEDTVCWLERTGSNRYKLFVCDIPSGESATIAMIDGKSALSRPFLYNDILLYTDTEGRLVSYSLKDGSNRILISDMTVHDPQMNGSFTAFLTGYHGFDSDLMYMGSDGVIRKAASGVTDFSLGDTFIAYGDLAKSYVYFPEDEVTFCVTRNGEKSLFSAAGGDCIFWLDSFWRDKDVLEYMHVNDL